MSDHTTIPEQRETIIAETRNVDFLPTTALKVYEMLENPNVDFDELAELVRHDQALTANLLQIANSSAFRGRGSVGTVREAILRVGMQHLHGLVIGLALAPIEREPVRGYHLPAGELWRHAVAVAVGTETIAESLKLGDSDEAFTAGLLHDVGKVVLGTFIETDSDRIQELAFEQKVSFERAEQQILGINHAEVGALLLRHWEIPDHLAEVTRWHHSPDGCEHMRSAVDLVHMADSLSFEAGVGTGSDGLNYRPCDEAVERLGVDRELSEKVILAMTERLQELE